MRPWLNCYWKVVGQPVVREDPFTYQMNSHKYGIRIIPLEVPVQKQNAECGIYVCAFIIGILQLMGERFAFLDIEDKFWIVTDSEHFKFDHEDIVSFNTSYRILLAECRKNKEAIASTHFGVSEYESWGGHRVKNGWFNITYYFGGKEYKKWQKNWL